MKKNWILVVDDDPDIRECLSGILDDCGYAVAEADNGAKALQTIAERGTPCMVILDLMMPVMDGVTFLEKVEESPMKDELNVIVASAASARERNSVRKFDSVREVLSKPFELDALLEIVSECGQPTPSA